MERHRSQDLLQGQNTLRWQMAQPENVEGEDLQRHMERLNQPMQEQDVLLYASQILEILDTFEQQVPPIIHGEIQPANIIIGTRDKRAHLIIDKTRDALKQQQASLHFLGYIPPEQMQNNADPRSDLYALAATMHHLLTKRDPRNYPRFVYPPVRTLNPLLSQEAERILTRALQKDITQRYQTANEMKVDIYSALVKHHRITLDLNIYAGEISERADNHTKNSKITQKIDALHLQTLPEFQAGSLDAKDEQPPSNSLQSTFTGLSGKWRRKQLYNAVLIMLALLLITGGLSWFLLSQHNGTLGPLPNDIGVIQAPNGEYIGISDGTFAFDAQRPGGNFKTQAAKSLQAKDFGTADSLWQQAVTKDTNDAEALIYMEDRRILDAGHPYITIVIATTLTGDANSIAIGRANTQAAYVAQKEYNTSSKLPNGLKVRFLIANSGSVPTYATPVARQIVQLAQKDKTIVAVMGWTLTAQMLNGIGVLSEAKIPMVTNSGADALTGRSPYFFRVTAPASVQGDIGARYAEQSLYARTAVLFVDDKNSFTVGLAKGFTDRFTSDGNTVVATESYTVGKPEILPTLLQNALSKHPDVIYFAGYPGDLGAILSRLRPSDPTVLGGSSLYQLGGYSQDAQKGLSHLRFTAYSYPDEWNILGLGNQKPAFFTDYQLDYDPNNQHAASPYGYDRPDGTTMEMYDAISALLYGCRLALAEKSTITGSDLQHALTQITGYRSFQGVTSQISFGTDSNPTDRAIVLICVSGGQFLQMDGIYGKFLVGEANREQIFTPSACS